MNVTMRESLDGGKTLKKVEETSHHGDDHALWIDPDNTKHWLLGSDGGMAGNFRQRQELAVWSANLPTVQFYDVAVDNALPFYNVCGGTQDNFSWCGLARYSQSEWDWGIQTGSSLLVGMVFGRWWIRWTQIRFIRSRSTACWCGMTSLRGRNWCYQPREGKGAACVAVELGFAGNHLSALALYAAFILRRINCFAAMTGAIPGRRSAAISDAAEVERNKLPVMGKVWDPGCGSQECFDFALWKYRGAHGVAEKEDLIYVGTDDGLIQTSADGGRSWTRYEKFPGIPGQFHVT